MDHLLGHCRLRRLLLLATSIVLCVGAIDQTWARGVSPYLPLDMSPSMERQIERVLILADQAVMRRPIAAATVLDALPKACKIDAQLCARVRRYLDRYMQDASITQLQAQLALTGGDSDLTLPNAHGMKVDSPWQVGVQGHYQFNDYMLASVGGIAYDGRATPTGTLLSLGFDWAQLDIGYRDHWLSPMTDSSMLISTQAPTMPSVTVSNYVPLGPLGINYQVFLAEMSHQDGIQYFNSTTAGRPRLAGLQLGIEPVSGYSLAVNRLMQYGGGARTGGGLSQFKDALFKNSNTPDVTGQSEEFGNQVASITASMLFPGKTPFAVHAEYAGEDNTYSGPYRLGDTDLSIGIDFPKLGDRYDLTYEISEWQNVWYTHHLYPEGGLTNHGHVLGHWFGDQRQFGDAVGGRSQMLRVGAQMDSGDYWQATYRTLQNQPYSPIAYRHLHELGINYSTSLRGYAVGAEVAAGRDVFGDSFARIAATLDLAGASRRTTDMTTASADPESDTDVFVDVGTNTSRVYQILTFTQPSEWTATQTNYHFGVGARRPVSQRSALGARLEIDRVAGNSLISVRMLDYRYKLTNKVALSAFFGAGRYEYGIPTYGYYSGVGAQWMNVLPKWDLGMDVRHHEKLSRDRLLPNDPPYTNERPRIHFDVNGVALYLSRHF
jgi:Capsule assembly protein Wzi